MKARFTLDADGEFPVEVLGSGEDMAIIHDPEGDPWVYYVTVTLEEGYKVHEVGELDIPDLPKYPDCKRLRLALAAFDSQVVRPYKEAQAKHAKERKEREKLEKAKAKALSKARGKSIRY